MAAGHVARGRSSLAGLGGASSRYLQITAPVQPGIPERYGPSATCYDRFVQCP